VRGVRLDDGDEAELAITDGCLAGRPAAGSSAARAYLGRPGFVPGAPADLVTYHDDPRNDPAVLKQPAAIIRRDTRIR